MQDYPIEFVQYLESRFTEDAIIALFETGEIDYIYKQAMKELHETYAIWEKELDKEEQDNG